MKLSKQDRVRGALWGALIGDALGVPVEFESRHELKNHPVSGMQGHGVHDQPKGTWSDDGSLLLCTADSLRCSEFDTEDMGKRFIAWLRTGLWSARGTVFDVGRATYAALSEIESGVHAETAGGVSEHSNGNGSLMRILPVALKFAEHPQEILLDRIHRASAITHRHPRSQIACGFYALLIRELLQAEPPREAYVKALAAFRSFYETNPYWAAELADFRLILSGDLAERSESDIDSSGYVVSTLIASVWCLLTTDNFRDTLLKAVNLGDDTDTTGCVTGGLAGVTYGDGAIPIEWREAIPRAKELEMLFAQFSNPGPQ